MDLLYTFYGDDFTGSTDVLERLASAGLPAVLFLAPPTPAQLAEFPGVRAVGVAGDSRSRSPQWMSEHLPGIFSALAALGAPVLHYKVCSTFDSSPTHGSIGRVLELGLAGLHSRFVPIIVGAPHLRRYVHNAQLFAAAPDGAIHRIDRHPMRLHPVTPMREPDLRRHLAPQTSLPVGHLTADRLDDASLDRELRDGHTAVLLDTFDTGSLHDAGALVWRAAQQQPLFGIGSSGFTAALIEAWQTSGILHTGHVPHRAKAAAGPLLVVSGSCSAATERQIRWSLENGFTGIALEPSAILAGSVQTAIDDAAATLGQGTSVVLYTALGTPASAAAGDALGAALGRILRTLLQRTAISRAVICGGDTSSHAVQQLGIQALTWAADLQTGVPLCRAHGPGWNHLELILKGGQVGSDDFFRVARDGTA